MRSWTLRVLLVVLALLAVGAVIVHAWNGGTLHGSSAPPRVTEVSTVDTTAVSTTTTMTTTTEAPATTTTIDMAAVYVFAAMLATTTTEAPTTTRAPSPPSTAPRPVPVTTAPHPVQSGGGLPAFLVCVRQRESGGNYSINTGNGYYGAFQFSLSTWNNTAAHAGRGDLVGVLPSNVASGDQDAMAISLYSWQGRQPWAGPGC